MEPATRVWNRAGEESGHETSAGQRGGGIHARRDVWADLFGCVTGQVLQHALVHQPADDIDLQGRHSVWAGPVGSNLARRAEHGPTLAGSRVMSGVAESGVRYTI